MAEGRRGCLRAPDAVRGRTVMPLLGTEGGEAAADAAAGEATGGAAVAAAAAGTVAPPCASVSIAAAELFCACGRSASGVALRSSKATLRPRPTALLLMLPSAASLAVDT
jgi:hypothetical protein